VIGLIDLVFGLPPLAGLPDEMQARITGEDPRFATAGVKQTNLGPHDANTPGTGALLSGFDPARLAGTAPPLPPSYAEIDDPVVNTLPHMGGQGCHALGITPEDVRQGIVTMIPADFNPRPSSNPTP
jgi:phospholipase C